MNHKHLLTAALLATVNLVLSDDSGQPNETQADFAFYKLSLIWPPSICVQPETKCKPNALDSFKILGLWPFYSNNTVVPPYNPITNRCSTVPPPNPDAIIDDLEPIRDLLAENWPDITDYESEEANEDAWKTQWKLHGMCSDYSDNPFMYFISGLSPFYGILDNPFDGSNVVPRCEPYRAQELLEAIKENVDVYPEIACDKVKGDLFLREIRICLKRNSSEEPPGELQDCPQKYAYNCHDDNDQVRYINADINN